MLGLCSDETNCAMTNYNDRDDDGNEDRNDDDNAAYGSGSDLRSDHDASVSRRMIGR